MINIESDHSSNILKRHPKKEKSKQAVQYKGKTSTIKHHNKKQIPQQIRSIDDRAQLANFPQEKLHSKQI